LKDFGDIFPKEGRIGLPPFGDQIDLMPQASLLNFSFTLK